MRKRIIIGLLAAVVIGVVAFFVSQPKKGSVEWHKREVLRILKKPGPSLMITQEEVERVENHHKELIRLGYMEEREFVITNRPMAEVLRVSGDMVAEDPKFGEIPREFVSMKKGATNSLVVVARPKDMQMISEVIRKADVPEIGK